MRSWCAGSWLTSYDEVLTPMPPPQASPDLVLRCQVIVDPRFTDARGGQMSESIAQPSGSPPLLRVKASVGAEGTLKAIYILWWETPDPNRPAPDPANPCKH